MASRRHFQLGSNQGPQIPSPQFRRLLKDIKISCATPVKEEDGGEHKEFVFKTPSNGHNVETVTSKQTTPLKIDTSPPRTPASARLTPQRTPRHATTYRKSIQTPGTPRQFPLRETIISRVEERLADVETECRKQINAMFVEFSARLTQQIMTQRRNKQEEGQKHQ